MLNFKLRHSFLWIAVLLSAPSFAHAEAFQFSLISFNTWGVPFAVKDTFRYGQAMAAIEAKNPDFVFLEELFSHRGRSEFHSDLYPYEVDGPRALPRIVSGGIRFLSKYPVLRSAKMHFWNCVADDCLSKKGALFALVQLPNGKLLNVIGTHLNARGEDDVRQAQLDQIKLFLDEFAEPGAPLLISGDFNYNPSSPAYAYGLNSIALKDAWTETHASTDLGVTYDTVKNQYAHDYCIAHGFPLSQDRIDYVLYQSSQAQSLKALSSEVIFDQAPFLSDHFGLSAQMVLDDANPAADSVANALPSPNPVNPE